MLLSMCVRVAGLLKGDVLRAFSTLALRYDSQLKEKRMGPGIPAVLGSDELPLPRAKPAGIGSLFGFAKFINPETRPSKALFVTDGMPKWAVTDALVANEPDKVSEIVLIFERPG